jgi:hypothetical protein
VSFGTWGFKSPFAHNERFGELPHTKVTNSKRVRDLSVWVEHRLGALVGDDQPLNRAADAPRVRHSRSAPGVLSPKRRLFELAAFRGYAGGVFGSRFRRRFIPAGWTTGRHDG